MNNMSWERYYIGDGCLCWQLGNAIDADISGRVLQLYRQVRLSDAVISMGIHDVVPAYNALAVYFDPAITDTEKICVSIEGMIAALPEKIDLPEGKTHVLPVSYTGPDISRIATHCNLPEREVIEFHSAGTYLVAMIGFKPHFPYLIGLDPRLETPRLDSPRIKVPAGSVAIGGKQTGVYPSDSPGGWNIIGSTDIGLLTAIQPGDIIRFQPQENR